MREHASFDFGSGVRFGTGVRFWYGCVGIPHGAD